MFALNNKNYLCIVDYNSKFPIMKKGRRHVHRQLNTSMQNYFLEYGLPKKIMSYAGGNFISYKFKEFYENMNIEQATLSLYHHPSNGQIESCVKFIV